MRLYRFAIPLLAAALVTVARPAVADDKATCIAASENAQKLKDDQHLLAARDAFQLCARDVCPTAVRKDCGENFEALDKKLLPTLVIRARSAAGEDLVSASVKLDGQSVPLDGIPVVMDPGRHTIVVTTGDDSKRVEILAAQGERDRVVVVTLDAKVSAPKAAPTPPADRAPSDAQPASGGSVVPVVLGIGMLAVGAVGLGLGVLFLVNGMSASSSFDAEGTGLKTCSYDASGTFTTANAVQPAPCHVTDSSGLTYSDRANRDYVIMGVTGVLGLAFATVGTVLLVTSAGSKPKATARVYPLVTPTQAGLGLGGTF